MEDVATTRRRLSSTPARRRASSFLQNAPAPPRLPPDQQAEFERLQRAAEAALSSHTTVGPAPATEQPQQQPLTTSRHVSMPLPSAQPHPHTAQKPPAAQTQATTPAAGAAGAAAAPVLGPEAGSLSGGIRRGAPPEFEGDRNPRTGEVGGPKNEPLRWGSTGDWSFNGRVTDF
ncbi:a079654b-94b9-4b81-b518-38e48885ac90 [Thermothielavioides terrestris]|uniref:Succinate dehydrogenase assembly factor 4, mitochondrial n=1 Tax=Thermothielavioides terrestris TaxID=2587410 RepID=A0A3S4BRB5_9PEZI|nr:a079654b-94b9-4b81-b518-38e48885ac90 [Thermothielavioides terrestris]